MQRGYAKEKELTKAYIEALCEEYEKKTGNMVTDHMKNYLIQQYDRDKESVFEQFATEKTEQIHLDLLKERVKNGEELAKEQLQALADKYHIPEDQLEIPKDNPDLPFLHNFHTGEIPQEKHSNIKPDDPEYILRPYVHGIGNKPDTKIEMPLMAAAAGAAAAGNKRLASATLLTGAAAYGANVVNKKFKNEGIVLPGTDHVGPGNKILIGPARSKTDQVAKEHDIEYDTLINEAREGKYTEEEFKQKLFDIDKKAIDEFAKTDDWQGFIAKWGLKLKTNIEQTLDRPIYPGE